MIRRVTVGLVLSALVVAGACIDKQNNDDRARACAHRLGVRWTVEDGATERLAAFKRCMA